MRIKIVSYAPSSSPLVQAFVAIEVDGWLRFNGLNFYRDGTLHPAQLTPWRRDGRRLFFDAVEVIDDDLRELLTADILAAINEYVAKLPPDERMRPPRLPANVDGRSPNSPEVCSTVEITPTASKSAPAPANGKKALPPPRRLLTSTTKGGNQCT